MGVDMKKSNIIFLLLAGALLLTGSQKEKMFGRGRAIQFTAVSSNIGTKTAYSGTETSSGGKTYERIDWKAGDNIRIWSDVAVHSTISDQHWSDYQVAADGTPDDVYAYYSNASLVNEANNGLVWGAAGNYTFHAIYPAQAISADGTSVTTACSIPASQSLTIASGEGKPDMSYAFMDGTGTATTTTAGEGVPVTLQFYPAFTAFEIALRSKTDPLYLGSFSIQSDGGSPIAGDFSIEFNNDTDKYQPSSVSGATQSQITVALNDTEITSTTSFKFTVLALPETLDDLSITFQAKSDVNATTYTSRTLKLKRNNAYISFPACAKHRIYGLALNVNDWIVAAGEDIEWDAEGLLEDIIWDTL